MNFDETKQVVMELDLASACNNPTSHTVSPSLKDCYDRWNPKSWTK